MPKKNKIINESWGHQVELQADTTGPIVFHFRPTKFMIVKEEKREDWEKVFRKYVGLVPDKSLLPELRERRGKKPLALGGIDWKWSGDPKETISGSNDDWDDCDYW